VAEAAAPALASVPEVAALVECQEVGARELADLDLVAGRAQRVNQEAFGKLAVVPAPEEVWELEVPQEVEQGMVRAAGQVRAQEVPEADPEGAAAVLVRVAEPAVAVGLELALEAVGLVSAAEAVGLELAAEAVGLGLAAEAVGLELAAEAVGLGLAAEAVGLGLAAEAVGLGLAVEAVGLGLAAEAVGLGLALEVVGLGLAVEALAPVVELAAGKPLEGG